jgi:uncharacterized protein YcaQ
MAARRLAITRQRLAGPRPPGEADGIFDLVCALGCLQLDPISVVARSHLLVLWSRLGAFDPAHLDTLLWRERRLFEYWAHCASIVPTEDYPLHRPMMRSYAAGDGASGRRARAWVEENIALRDHILTRLAARGPLPARAFESRAVSGWASTGWTSGRNVSRMLDFLWITGTIMVAGRSGQQKLWDLAERCLPAWAPRGDLSEREVVRRAAERSLRALGVATPAHIQAHFLRGRYPGLAGVLAELEAAGRIVSVHVVDGGHRLPGRWYVHADDLPQLDRLAAGDGWVPRTTLLSPFDNLICDRRRTETLLGFEYRVEIYVPRVRRRYGYYVLPILHGDRLIGRIDPTLDRGRQRLVVHAVHAEPDAPPTAEAGRAVAAAVADLACFLGAREVAYGDRLPAAWAPRLVGG